MVHTRVKTWYTEIPSLGSPENDQLWIINKGLRQQRTGTGYEIEIPLGKRDSGRARGYFLEFHHHLGHTRTPGRISCTTLFHQGPCCIPKTFWAPWSPVVENYI